MQRMRRADDDHIDIADHGHDVGKRPDTIFRRECLGPSGRNVAGGHELRLVEAFQRGCVNLTDLAAADQANSYWLHFGPRP